MLEFLRDACISRHGQFEVKSDLEKHSSSRDDSLPEISMKDDVDELDDVELDMFGKVSMNQKTFTQSALEPKRKLNNDLHIVHGPSLAKLDHQSVRLRPVYIKN